MIPRQEGCRPGAGKGGGRQGCLQPPGAVGWPAGGVGMTEAEWLGGAGGMVRALCEQFGAARTRQGRRRLRLLACAMARRVWPRLDPVREQPLVVAAEALADGNLSDT